MQKQGCSTVWSLLLKWHNFDVSFFFHQQLLVFMKTDPVFLDVHVLCRDLLMGELGSACLCLYCYREIIEEWYRKDFFLHRYTPDLLQTKYFWYMSLCLCKVLCTYGDWASCRAFSAVPFQIRQPHPKYIDQACPLSASHLCKRCANLRATLKKWWVSMLVFSA